MHRQGEEKISDVSPTSFILFPALYSLANSCCYFGILCWLQLHLHLVTKFGLSLTPYACKKTWPLLHELLISFYLIPAGNIGTMLPRVWAHQHTDTANISKSCLDGLLLCIVTETQPWARQLSFQETGKFSWKGLRHSSVGTKHVEVLI